MVLEIPAPNNPSKVGQNTKPRISLKVNHSEIDLMNKDRSYWWENTQCPNS